MGQALSKDELIEMVLRMQRPGKASLIGAIRRALSDAGIDMPFPTRVVLLHDQMEETDGDGSRQREGWPAGDKPPKTRHLNEVRMERLAQGDSVQNAKTDELEPPVRRQ